MYFILKQKKFDAGNERSAPPSLLVYGPSLYLAKDFTHFLYDGKQYKLKYLRMTNSMKTEKNLATNGIRGLVNVNMRKYYYSINDNVHPVFAIVSTNDVNIYLHNKFEFSYVLFNGMQFYF